MAHVLNDRIKETTTTTGTGNISLAGAETGFETFVSGVGDGNTTYYAISHQTTNEFEIGLGTVNDASPDTISGRTNSNVISSSNSDNVVDFSAGTKDVFCTLPASKAITLDHQSVVNVVGSISIGDSSNRVILSKGSDNQIQFQTEASGQSAVNSNSGATKVYADISAMTATSPTTGDQAFVTANTGLYIFNGGGWYKVATVNTTPSISSPSNGANVTLAVNGTATAVELVGSDTDPGTTLQNSYAVTTGSLTNGGGATAAITSSATADGTFSALSPSTNTTNRFFKVTPTTNSSYAGTFSITYSMSDGISAGTTVQNYSLNFGYDIEILLIGGGGSGGKSSGYGDYQPGGGGGGGVILSGTYAYTSGVQLDIVVGAGGAGFAASATRSIGNTGVASSIQVNGAGSTFISLARGGGAGGSGDGTGTTQVGGNGANGGGGYASGGIDSPGMGYGVNGTEVAGFHGAGTWGTNYGGGAGGGAGANGNEGNGGDGINTYATWATATSTGDSGYYGGGGAGSKYSGSGTLSGGAGGGGDGSFVSSSNWQGAAGAANTGGGGGAGGGALGQGAAGAGGSGLVVIRYSGSARNSQGNSVVTTGGYTYHIYSATGSATYTD